MNLGMIGMGIVGGTTAKVLGRAHKIYPYDKYKPPYNSFQNLEKIAENCEATFICVPTPMQKDRSIDYSPIHNSVGMLLGATYKAGKKPEDLLVIVKSTAVSGTTDGLSETYPFQFAFNPEFLREKTPLEDTENPSRIILGVQSKKAEEKLYEIFKPVFPNAKYIVRDRKTAEMDKYASNVILASQVLLGNIIKDACDVKDIDYDKVKEDTLLDQRIGRNIDVPGPDGFRGFGGKCFPKDFNAFLYEMKKHGARKSAIKVLEALWEYNVELRGEKGRDWLSIPGAISENSDFTKNKS